jgi:hypothetical protein
MEKVAHVPNNVFNCITGPTIIEIGHTKHYGVGLDINQYTLGKNGKEIKLLIKNTRHNFYILYIGKEVSKLERVHNPKQESGIEKTFFIRVIFNHIKNNTDIYPDGGKFLVFNINGKSYAFSQDEDKNELILQKVKIIPLSEETRVSQRSVGND